MATYLYRLISTESKICEGTAEGTFGFLVKKQLEKDGSTVLFITKEKKFFKTQISLPFLDRVSTYEKILFFRNFSMMLDSGVSISTSLHTLKKQFKSLSVQKIMSTIAREVENGNRLSRAMEKYPRIFPLHVTKTIEVGEQSGSLSQTLSKISDDIEKNYELKRKVGSAIAYPVIILLFMLSTALLLVIFVLPQLMNLYGDLGAQPPWITRWLSHVGSFALVHPILLFASALVIFATFWYLLRIKRARYMIHLFILHMPVIGNLVREYNIVRFTRALTTLLSSGITFINALDACKSTLNNEVYLQNIEKIYPVILHGGTFSSAIESLPFLFPEQLRQTIIVGENAGKMKECFRHNSVHYERSVNYQTQMLTTLIEPFLMLAVGLMVGLLAYSIFAPLYQVTTLF
jgi:type IV pilus assembly protein PilC